jgi:large repetitive protein
MQGSVLILPIHQPMIIPPTLVKANIATVNGAGQPGASINLYCGDKIIKCVTAKIASDGTWTISTSSKLTSGSTALIVRAMDSTGAESNAVAAQPGVILAPPLITKTSVNQNIATVYGTGSPGGTIKVYNADKQLVGTGVVTGEGAFSISPSLPMGISTLTATIENTAGVSDDSASVQVDVKAASLSTSMSQTTSHLISPGPETVG